MTRSTRGSSWSTAKSVPIYDRKQEVTSRPCFSKTTTCPRHVTNCTSWLFSKNSRFGTVLERIPNARKYTWALWTWICRLPEVIHFKAKFSIWTTKIHLTAGCVKMAWFHIIVLKQLNYTSMALTFFLEDNKIVCCTILSIKKNKLIFLIVKSKLYRHVIGLNPKLVTGYTSVKMF